MTVHTLTLVLLGMVLNHDVIRDRNSAPDMMLPYTYAINNGLAIYNAVTYVSFW